MMFQYIAQFGQYGQLTVYETLSKIISAGQSRPAAFIYHMKGQIMPKPILKVPVALH